LHEIPLRDDTIPSNRQLQSDSGDCSDHGPEKWLGRQGRHPFSHHAQSIPQDWPAQVLRQPVAIPGGPGIE
jgi:hypothetical protein